jgi:hypothetical protein
MLLLLCLTLFVAESWQIRTPIDDAFISFRYARNLVEGQGLVFNPGEHIEGYTNLLWTLGLAAVARAGGSAVATAKYAGLAFYAALALALVRHAWRRSRDGARPFLPLAAALILLMDDFHVWASGGLETMLFSYLAVQGLLWTREPGLSNGESDGSGGNRGKAWAAGVFLALSVLTRPDGLLFAAVGIASFWLPTDRLSGDERWRRAIATAIPIAAVVAALIPFKLLYYGELLPTAFYSKSAWIPYPGQGWIYVGLLLWKNWFIVPLLAAALAAAGWAARHRAADSRRGDALLLVTAAGLFTAYLVQVGGDFMFARRLIPVLPLLFVAAEEALSRLSRGTAAGIALAACAGALLPLPLYGGEPGAIRGVYDERASYPETTLEARRRQAEAAGRGLAGLDVRAAFEGGMCVFGFYSGLPYLAEATGLTQYSLAKRPLEQRGVVGHEKRPDARWFEENRIQLLFKRDLPPLPAATPDSGAFDEIRFGNVVRAQILHYDAPTMDSLRGRPDVSFVPIEEALERSTARLTRLRPGDAQALLARLDRYYFRTAGPGAQRERERLHALVKSP